MSWTKLPKGEFTGIDWAKPNATAGFDPYLVWAEADNFSGYGNKRPKWLPIAIELKPGTTVQQLLDAASGKWLHVPPVYTSRAAPAGLKFCTARVRPDFFKHIQPGGRLHALVLRFELGLPAAEYADDPTGHGKGITPPHSSGADYQAKAQAETLLSGKVLALIDDSLALAHANFLHDGKARTAYFWRQDARGAGPTPHALGYGHELTASDINAAMQANTYGGLVDESAVYVALGLSTLGKKMPKREHFFHALDTSVSHGSHVMDLAAGPRTLLAQVGDLPPGFDAPPSWARADDDASRAALIAVQLDYDTVRDTSGGSMNVHVLDGLMYVLSRCDDDAKVTANISFGTLAGPHDGTALLEAAMDALIDLLKGRLQIALAAGNSYQLRTHANTTLSKNERVALHWRALPDDSTQSFVELWVEEDRDGLEITITPPGRAALPPLKFGESKMWTGGGKRPLCALIYPMTVATGRRGTCALLAVAPTFSFDEKTATAPSGVWQITLTNTGKKAITVDAYVERDDVVIGTRGGARQSHFEDAWYDTSGNPDSFVDHPDNPSLIRRSGSFNSIATGRKTVSVGGTRITGPRWAHYSPQTPDPDAGRTQRPGVTRSPDAQAFSDENPATLGVNAAGTRSGAAVRLMGTSDASPQQARRILNGM
ncbi:hypothetical protein [Polaromonas sp.]|uniref:hypothetical protein n=1 Tax=Polaromonas sp. TaxID=1869339 RepID=UPI00248823C0|nr:hypothetical protein [Polaromonas sp.]MDI1273582.1 hypothetical protein [Polaromonas sp.]